jgi:hypothetical protein
VKQRQYARGATRLVVEVQATQELGLLLSDRGSSFSFFSAVSSVACLATGLRLWLRHGCVRAAGERHQEGRQVDACGGKSEPARLTDTGFPPSVLDTCPQYAGSVEDTRGKVERRQLYCSRPVASQLRPGRSGSTQSKALQAGAFTPHAPGIHAATRYEATGV